MGSSNHACSENRKQKTYTRVDMGPTVHLPLQVAQAPKAVSGQFLLQKIQAMYLFKRKTNRHTMENPDF